MEDDLQMNRFLKHIDKVVAGYEKSKRRKGVETPQETEEQLKARLISEHRAKLAATEITNRLVQIPFTHPLPVPEVTVPSTEVEPTFEYQVFADLWQRGCVMTPGDTFGGTFLCYPGDPLHYHASHIIICCEGGTLSFDNVLKYARSSVIVNKICVFAYRGEDGVVKYQSLEWISTNKNEDVK